MKTRNTILSLAVVAALAATPLASAQARGWDHHGGWGRGYHGGYYHDGVGVGVLGAVIGATAALVTAPFALAGAIVAPSEPAYYPPQPVYAPAPVYG